MVAGEKGVTEIPLSYKFGSSRDEGTGCSKMGRTMMESKCYHVYGKGEVRAAHPAIGNEAFPWEGVGGIRTLSAWLLHPGELRGAS